MEIPSAVSANPESELSLYALPEVVTDEIVDGSGIQDLCEGSIAPEFIMYELRAERKCRSAHQLIIRCCLFRDRSIPSVMIQDIGKYIFDLVLGIFKRFRQLAYFASPPLPL
jgi:hypothetical protein